MLSFGDIDNYGDIFFALIFENEVKKRIRNVQIDDFAPFGGIFSGVIYKKYEIEELNKYDAVVLAGGEIVHKRNERTWDPIYSKRKMSLSEKNYSDIVWKMHHSTPKFKAFFSVGVLPLECENDRKELNNIINELSYFSVRGLLSKKIIENELNYNENIHITPDLGWYFAEYVNNTNIKVTLELPENYFIFQINSVDEREEKLIAQQLDQFIFENKNLNCVLLPIIKPWEDVKYLKGIYNKIQNKDRVFLSDYLNVIETGKVILHSKFVLGSSLHSAITAMSGAIPVSIINKWPGSKFQDLFFSQFKDEYLTTNINRVYNLCNKLKNYTELNHKADVMYSEFMRIKLQNSFDYLCSKIINNESK